MVKHIVMFKIVQEAFGKHKEILMKDIKHQLESLKGQIEGLNSIEVGINALPDPQSFDFVLSCEFEDEAAFERYKIDPKHVEVAQFIGLVKTDRAVVDYYK